MNVHEIRNQISNSLFPLGPNVAKYLEVHYVSHRKANDLSDEEIENFRSRFSQYIAFKSLESRTDVIPVLEELVGMQYGDLALKLNKNHDFLNVDEDFRGALTLGNAAMMEGDLELAKEFISEANQIDSEEIAPYVNLANIYFHEQQDQLAEDWALAGLKIEKNNRRLWEIMGLIFQVKHHPMEGDQLRDLAKSLDSWAGLSLAALLTDADDPLLRAEWLGNLHDAGERDPEFLIEYTAVLGTASQFKKIAIVVMQAEKLSKEPLPWQLYVHAIQSQLAAEESEGARTFFNKIKSLKELPTSVTAHLTELDREITLTEEKNKKLAGKG